MTEDEFSSLKPGDVFGFVPEIEEVAQETAARLGGPVDRPNPELVIHVTPQYVRTILCKYDGSFKRLTYMKEDCGRFCRWHHVLMEHGIDVKTVLYEYRKQAEAVASMYATDLSHLSILVETERN